MNLREIIEAFQNGLIRVCLWVLAALAAGCAIAWLGRSGRRAAVWWRSLHAWLDKIVFIGLFMTCILIGGTKLNNPPLPQMPLPQSVVQMVSDDEIAQGYRLESVATNDAILYVMPDGISPSFNWHKRGTFGEWARLDLGGFAFPLGTNDEAVTAFSVFNDGRIRPRPRDAAREICAVGMPMLVLQGASRFWAADGTGGSKLLTWENFFLNADTNAPVNAQVELFPDGDFIARSNNVERIYRRVYPFDYDGDGLENSVDPDPLVAGADAHGTNAEWYNTVCSNVLEAVGQIENGEWIMENMAWREGVNSNAYYFVDVVVSNGPAPIYFTGDRDSRLGNPVIVALGGATNHVPLLIGIDYAITSPVPFTVSYPMEYMYLEVETNGHCCTHVRWPLEFSVAPDGYGGFYTSAIPYDPGGTFQWGNGGVGGMRSGGIRSGDSGPACEYSAYGNWLGFMCYGADCGCHGCSVDGTYAMECSTFNLPTLFCACSYDDPDDPPDDPLDDPFSGTPSVSISFSQSAIIFEDRYEASPDNWVEKRSTTNTLSVSASGGASGATLILSTADIECLQRVGGGSVSLPAELVLGPYMSCTATFRCEGAGNGGMPSVSGIIAGLDGSDSSYAQTSVVRVEIQRQRAAPNNDRLNRHEYGIGERMYVYQHPTSPKITVAASDATVSSPSVHIIDWGISNIEHTLSFSLYGVEYIPFVRILKPTGIEGYDAQALTNGLPPGVAGGLELVQRYRILPLSVDFSGLQIEEVPCEDELPATGYFIFTPTNRAYRTHTRTAGAGRWYDVEDENYWGLSRNVRDYAGRKGALQRMMPDGTETTNTAYGWLGGCMTWKVPFGWRRRFLSSGDDPVGVFAEDTRQIMSITADGDFSVRKLGHEATRQINGPVSLDGHPDDGILDN